MNPSISILFSSPGAYGKMNRPFGFGLVMGWCDVGRENREE